MRTAATVALYFFAVTGIAFWVSFTALVIAHARQLARKRHYLRYHAALSRLPEAHQKGKSPWLP